ncbi:MAG: hypothetical protein AAFO75_13815, partial [Pseudomonadota bacterium]
MSVTTAPTAQTPRSSIWRLGVQAHGLFFENILVLARLASAWLVIVFTLSATLNWLLWPAEVANWTTPNRISEISIALSLVLTSLAGASLGVSWTRFILLNEPLHHAPMLRLDALVKVYFAVALVMVALPLMPMFSFFRMSADDNDAPFAALALTLLSIVMAIWAVIRLTPLFPAIAVDGKDADLGTIWLKTAWRFWPLFFGLVLTWMIPIVLIIGLQLLNPNTLLDTPPEFRWEYAVFTAASESLSVF